MFYRVFPDHARQSLPLENHFAGPQPTACWLIGGGPSLKTLPLEQIQRSPCPKFAVNLAGSGLFRPNFWTSYDPTNRFQKSIYLDPSVLKFVHACRAMDLIPETTFKVCEAPNLVCFDRVRGRGFHDFPTSTTPSVTRPAEIPSQDLIPGITDWQDSFIQAIDIAYRLGFRRLYLAGCDFFIAPPPTLIDLARKFNVQYESREPLGRFLSRCQQAGAARSDLERHAISDQYHFDEVKPFGSAVQTDDHYFRVAQYLRLSRRALSLAGLELISVTPHSRLNDYFPYQSVSAVAKTLFQDIGDPVTEPTRGRYTSNASRSAKHLAPMRDFRPHHWNRLADNAPPDKRPLQVEVPEEQIPDEVG